MAIFRKNTESQSGPSEPTAEQDHNAWMFWTSAQRLVVPIEELDTRFYFTEDRIVEMAPRDLSEESGFRDSFHYLAHQLRALEHRCLLKLLDFGIDNGRLYRVWESRTISSALCAPPSSSPESLAALSRLIEAFQSLRKAGLAIERFLLTAVSLDAQGYFIARFPFELDGAASRLHTLTILDHFSLYPELSPSAQFQLTLGNFIAHRLTGKMPFHEPPIYSRAQSTMPTRISLALSSSLRAVIHRLTDVATGSQYPTFDLALEELRSALAG